jgi:hypothetical protein
MVEGAQMNPANLIMCGVSAGAHASRDSPLLQAQHCASCWEIVSLQCGVGER